MLLTNKIDMWNKYTKLIHNDLFLSEPKHLGIYSLCTQIKTVSKQYNKKTMMKRTNDTDRK